MGTTLSTTWLQHFARQSRDVLSSSYEQAERRYRNGYISERQWRLFCLFWDWGAPRYTGTAGAKQLRLIERRGEAAFLNRMNKFRQALGLGLYRVPDALLSSRGTV